MSRVPKEGVLRVWRRGRGEGVHDTARLDVSMNTLSLILSFAKDAINRDLENPKMTPVTRSMRENLRKAIKEVEERIDDEDLFVDDLRERVFEIEELENWGRE